MKAVVDHQGREIGWLAGNLVKDTSGKVVYWISDEEVFAPLEYVVEDVRILKKGGFSRIGDFDGERCISNDEVIFKVK